MVGLAAAAPVVALAADGLALLAREGLTAADLRWALRSASDVSLAGRFAAAAFATAYCKVC